MFNQLDKFARPLVAIAALGMVMPAVTSVSAPAFAATRAGITATQPAALRNIAVPELNHFRYTVLDDAADPTFNQLLGINNAGKIVGYFGSGLAGHPNKGYRLLPPYTQGNYTNENFPGSVQTQVVAVNNSGESAGFWVDANGNNFGFIHHNNTFTSYRDPKTGTGTVNQILGLNDLGIAVGFYTDGAGVNHGFAVNQATGQFFKIKPPNSSNVMAAGINNSNDVTGSMTGRNGVTVGFLLKNNRFYTFNFPNASSTTPFGINASDEIVGSYMDAAGLTHGFRLNNPLTNPIFHTIDEPNGIGTTVVNGVNDNGDVVGFFTLGAITHGFVAKKLQ